MLRRELRVPHGTWTQESLGRSLGARPQDAVRVLVHNGLSFSLLAPGIEPRPGQRVVVYAFDLSSDEELYAVNAAFTDLYYVSAGNDPWPDERRVIEALVPERDAAVLEICCGAGRTAPALVRRGNQVTAIDISADCIEYAAQFGPGAGMGVDYRVADATALPFAERSFELGFCFENSLGMFFSQRPKVICELVRVCRRAAAFGLRQVPSGADEPEIYFSSDGFLEVAQLHTRASVERLLDALPAETRARIAGRRWLEGEARPWGGTQFFAVLDLVD